MKLEEFNSLLKKSDMEWGLDVFKKDKSYNMYDNIEEIENLVVEAINSGKIHAQKYKKLYNTKTIYEILDIENIKFDRFEEVPITSTLIMAQFFPDDTIVLYNKNIEKLQLSIKENGVENLNSIENTVLLHEFYHYLENKYSSTCFTQTYKKEIKIFGIFNRKCEARVLSEIAAMQFAKEYMDLDYNPFCLNYLMSNY